MDIELSRIKLQREEACSLREAYLADVSQKLSKRLSPLASFEAVQEIRIHVDAIAAAYEELGATPPEAMKSAVEKFGPAKQIGSELANSPRPKSTLSKPVGFLVTVAGEFLLGGLLFQLCENLFDAQFTVNNNPGTVIPIGGLIGGAVGIVAWFTHWSPKAFGIAVCIPLNVCLATQLYPTIMRMDRPERYFEISVVLTAGLYLLATAGVRLATYIREVKLLGKTPRNVVAD